MRIYINICILCWCIMVINSEGSLKSVYLFCEEGNLCRNFFHTIPTGVRKTFKNSLNSEAAASVMVHYLSVLDILTFLVWLYSDRLFPSLYLSVYEGSGVRRTVPLLWTDLVASRRGWYQIRYAIVIYVTCLLIQIADNARLKPPAHLMF